MSRSLLYLFASVICVTSIASSQLSPPYTCTTTTTLCKPTSHGQDASTAPRHHSVSTRQGKRGPVGPKGDRGQPCEPDPKYNSTIAAILKSLEKMESQMNNINDSVRALQHENEELKLKLKNISEVQETAQGGRPSTCKDHLTAVTRRRPSASHSIAELYPFQASGDSTTLEVDCVKSGSHSWMVIQRRINGSVNFNRQWESYAEGFGDPGGEYWIGLRNLHKLTSPGEYRLRIDLGNRAGDTRYALYEKFAVKSERNNFELEVSGYSGNAGDGMKTHSGMGFTTSDRDNSKNLNCAAAYPGGWWFRSCYGNGANLNGLYPQSKRHFHWLPWMDPETLKSSEMKIEPVE